MKVGINGMGRIGRLALRAAFGGVPRADGRSARATTGSTSSTSTRSRAAPPPPRICSNSTACTAAGTTSFGVDGETRASRSATTASASAPHAAPGDVAWGDLGCDIVLECTGKFLKPEQLQAYFDRGVKRVIVAAPVKDERALNIVVGVNDQLYDPGAAPAADGGVLHHQLPGAGGQGRARGDRHPARPDHHHPRSDQHQRRRRCAAQGSAPRALGHAVAAADDDRQRHRDRADLSRTEGQAERPRRPRAGAQRQPDRLRVRTEAADHRDGGQRAVPGGGRRAAGRHSRLSRRGRWCRPTTATTRAARSSMRRAPW